MKTYTTYGKFGNRIRKASATICEDCGKLIVHPTYRKIKYCADCGSRKSIGTHNQSDTRLFKIWGGMKNRCSNKHNQNYNKYGGRGISFCKEWNAFEEFYEWAMLNGYSDELTIDRIDNDGNYEPSNCRWVNFNIQAANRGMSRRNSSGYIGVSYIGRLDKWRADIGVNGESIYLGIFDYSWTAALVRDSYIIVNNLQHRRNIG